MDPGEFGRNKRYEVTEDNKLKLLRKARFTEIFRVLECFTSTLLEKLVNVRKIRHNTSVKFTEQVLSSFFPLVYGIK